ncbi:hypothetical protein BGZ92_002236 [Podila epicladia]|nr:hypothetical protein BGZ92_002236 [Podila epicladia]
MEGNIDTLEVLLNPSIIRNKFSVLSQDKVYIQGRRLLQDLLSVARFGTPTIVPAEPAPSARPDSNGEDNGGQMQTMQLSERQDMLLGQACKVYHFASLSLDDIFEYVPQQNQLCLFTAMMMLAQKPTPETTAIVSQTEPWDPLTLLQRWIVRSRVAGTESTGLDLGDIKFHAEALEEKLYALKMQENTTKSHHLQCQIASELGQYHCWSGDFVSAQKFLNQCQDSHKLHLADPDAQLSCRLNLDRIGALSKLSKLALGVSLDDTKHDFFQKVKVAEQEHRHKDLVPEFIHDNTARILPYPWRQRVVLNVLERSDVENGTMLALTNALYRAADPSHMLLEIPSSVLVYLRSIPFGSGDESEAFLGRNVFEDIMQLISSVSNPTNEKQCKEFAAKFCATIRHVLCYEAAWKSGILQVTDGDWNEVWSSYSAILTQEGDSQQIEDDALDEDDLKPLSVLLGGMDSDELEQFVRSKNMSPLGSSLIILAMAKYCCSQSHYVDAVRYVQSARRVLPYEQESNMPLAAVDAQLTRLTLVTEIGILVEQMEERRDEKLESRLKFKAVATKSATSATAAEPISEKNSTMEVDTPEDDTVRESQRQKRIEEAKDSAMVEDLSNRLQNYLSSFGALETNLQLRALALCIDGKQWDFLAIYCRNAVGIVDASIHPEIFQVYSVLAPLSAILGKAKVLNVDLKDTTSLSCLELLVTSDLNPIDVTRMAALDMIQGLLVNVSKPNMKKHQQLLQAHAQSLAPPNMPHQNQNHFYRGRRSFQAEPQSMESIPPPPPMDEDVGHATILKLLELVRLRGVVDVFGAILTGALSSLMPEKSKLTLSEFGYYALFTTSMDCVSSWTDPRVKIIAMLSSGNAGKAIESVPGAKQRFTKMLLKLYENQIQFESDSLTAKIGIETKARQEAGLTTSSSTLSLFSSKSSSRITRFSLCLTELYHVEGMHRDAFASFLNGCMISSKCFSDFGRLDRRIWSAYTFGPTNTAPSPQPGIGGQPTVPSQPGGPLTQMPFNNNDPLSSLPQFPTSSSLAGMSVNGQLSVGLGLFPGELVPLNGAAPLPVPPQATPSTPAMRAIESCILLNEPLASAALQQFLPRMDYAKAFQAIRSAHEKGLLSFSTAPTAAAMASLQPPRFTHASPVPGGIADGTGSFSTPSLLTGSPKIESSLMVFSPDTRIDTLGGGGPMDNSLSGNNATNTTMANEALLPLPCLDLIFDMPLLELVSFLFKEAGYLDGQSKLQAKINSNRMALDSRQPFKDQVYAMAQQDLLTRLWAKYAKVG